MKDWNNLISDSLLERSFFGEFYPIADLKKKRALYIDPWCEYIHQWVLNLLILHLPIGKNTSPVKEDRPAQIFLLFIHPILVNLQPELMSFWGRLKPNKFHQHFKGFELNDSGISSYHLKKAECTWLCRYSDQSHALKRVTSNFYGI